MVEEWRSTEPDYAETATLVRELDAMKRHGSALLVVGSVPDRIRTHACEAFLGTDVARRRLFVLTEGREPPLSCLPQTHRGGDHTRVVEYHRPARSATAATSTPLLPVPTRTVSCGRLSELGIEISGAIEALDRAACGLSPAELRLCFDSLVPVLASSEEVTVFRFLHLLTHRVRSVDGMAHLHLPIDPDTPVVGRLTPLFDAVVELAETETGPAQRWTLRDRNLETGWLSL
ncbi:DUF7504 family protein [Natronorarus salvus]|uniref:DUF7504 family protein n=1 Tax=Natronorarus salvus TaxID=3117733 RepID=UPI002F26960B